MDALILETGQIKKIVESEIICGITINYMSDVTSYSDSQLIKINSDMSLLEKTVFSLSVKNDELEKYYTQKLVKEKSRLNDLKNLLEDKKWWEQKLEQLKKITSHKKGI